MALCILSTVFLTGCICNPTIKEVVVTEYKYVVRTADEHLKEEPVAPAMIDIENSTQIDLANWIAKNHAYAKDLRVSRKRLIEFYEKPPTQQEMNALKHISILESSKKQKTETEK